MKFNTIIFEEDLKGFQGTGMIGLSPKTGDGELFTDKMGVKSFSINLSLSQNQIDFNTNGVNSSGF